MVQSFILDVKYSAPTLRTTTITENYNMLQKNLILSKFLVQLFLQTENDLNKMDVRNVIAKEGRSARNLVSWHVPARNIQRKVNRSNSVKTSKSDTRCASIKYEPRKQKISTQARYWSYLFENLKRAVDEIYELCSQDSSVDECKEAIMILECYKHEFESLSTWINLEKELKVSNKQ